MKRDTLQMGSIAARRLRRSNAHSTAGALVFALSCLAQSCLAQSCDDRATQEAAQVETDTPGRDAHPGEDTYGPPVADGAATNHYGEETSSADTTSSGCVALQPRHLDWLVNKPDKLIPGTRVGPLVEIFKTAEELRQFAGTPPPSTVRFPDEWALLVAIGTTDVWSYLGGGGEVYFPQAVTVDAGEACSDGLHLRLSIDRPQECELFADRAWPAYGLFAVDASAFSLGATGAAECELTGQPFPCADEGAPIAAPCGRELLCQPGAFCAGMTTSSAGVCVSADHTARFESAVATPIPDGAVAAVSSENIVVGLTGSIADLVVEAEFDHPSMRDLTITLVDPSGMEAVVWDRDAVEDTRRQARPVWQFQGRSPNGTWTLRLADGQPGNVGELDRWAIALLTVDP